MFKINTFIIILCLFVHIAGGECPAPCICKKIKSQPTATSNLLRAQCGGTKNKISSLNEIDLSSVAENLVQLDLSSNSLTSLETPLNFPQLHKLDLSKNKLTSIEPNVFKDLPNLQRLDLSTNSLKYINKEWFTGLTKLERLKLSGNQITRINRGTFDDLIGLKQMDISNNPLICDCELLWLLDWLQNTSVKFMSPPKCASPPSFKGHLLRKIKVGVEIHCRSPIRNRDQTEIELKPDQNQVVYEGDSIKIRCRAPGVTSDIFTAGEESYSSARIHWRFNLDDPKELFREIKVENRYLDDSGMLDSVLNIGIISRNHTGQWTCHLVSEKGNHSKSISLFVISNSTKYCPSTVTTNNKGTYIWPRTILDTVVEQQCQGQQLSGLYHITHAVYYCSEFGTWRNLNTTACPYISEVTKILEQFSKVNLNLTKGNLIESVRHLKNYTTDGKLLRDKMDIVFISRTIMNYIVFVKTERELGAVLIEIISSLMNLNRKLLEDAQVEDQACSRLVEALAIISEYTPSPQTLKRNLAVEDFRVKPENFNGLTCAWYSNTRGGRLVKPFFCSTTTNLPYMSYDDELIEASIQIPSTLFLQLEQQGYSMTTAFQLIIAMFENNKFFPTFHMKEVITSPVVGATLVDIDVSNLTDPVTVMYRYPLLQDIETPTLGWWDMKMNNGVGGWNMENGCELSHYFHESLIFSCTRLNYFGMLQDVQYAPTSYVTGAKFHFSHPAIYAGTCILITCLFIIILTYLLCFNSIQIAKRAKHSLVNTWTAICLLCYIYTFGIFQTEDIFICQIVGIIIHYLTLSILLWMCVSVTTMYKRLSKTTSIHLPVDELPPDQPIQKPILGLYLVGWGIALIVCGISGAVNMREYASHAYCFLYSGPALSAVFVPAIILIIFIIICSLMIRCAIRCSDVHGQLSEGTQATENVDLDLLEPNLPNISIDRHSVRSVSSQTASSNIEDPEHCPSKQLKAHIIVLIFYVLLWMFGALSARRIFKNILPYDERVFSILYAVVAAMLGAFVLFFYGVARNDVRTKWAYVKRVWCRTRSISDMTNLNLTQNLNQPLTPMSNPQGISQITGMGASVSGLTTEINNSRSSSRTSSHTKSQNSNILKGAVDLNNVNLNDPDAEAKIANVNLVVLHRQQYRTNNTIPIYNDNGPQGAEIFYNPHQSTVARKFFKKQRKNMIKHNNLGTRRTRGDGGSAMSDNASIISANNKNTPIKTPHKTNTDLPTNTTNIFGSGAKINNINIHVEPPVKEMKQQNKNILSDSGDESEILIDHVTGSVTRILAERENMKVLQQRQKYTKNNDGSPKRSASKYNVDDLHDKVQSSSNNELDDNELEGDRMRTVSQQCSLEYSSDSPEADLNDTDADNVDDLCVETNVERRSTKGMDGSQEDDIDDHFCTSDMMTREDIIENLDEVENLECNLTPENNEGMYSITDLSQNLLPDDNSSAQNDFDSIINVESTESVHSHVLYPHMPRSIYENPLHSHLLETSGSTSTIDSETLFARYQPSEASVVNSMASDCEECDDDEEKCAQSPVSASEIDELYEQINRPPQIIVHTRPSNYLNETRSRSPILFPPSISFESSLNDIEVNTDFRFNAQGIVATSSKKIDDDSETDSDEIKIETTV